MVVTEFNCHFSSRGISTVEFSNNDFTHISHWRDFYDAQDFENKLKECDLFSDSFTGEDEPKQDSEKIQDAINSETNSFQ